MARTTKQALVSSALAVGLIGAACPIAQAQNFEAYYGEADWRDRGEDVKWVDSCPGGGSIAVGSRADAVSGSEVLVTRVDGFGTTLWQRGYAVAGARFSGANGVIGLHDSLRGFAITGYASRDDTRMFAMRINCEGKPLWTRLFNNQGTSHRGVGYDVVALDPSAAGSLAQILVIGEERLPNGTSVGRIARLDGNGNPLFDLAYGDPTAPPGLRFRAATLAPGNTATSTDLVVAGSAGRFSDWSFDRRGLMFRVRLDGTPVCNAVLGAFDSPSEDFFGLSALRAPASLRGHTVLVGATTPAAGTAGQRAYLARFRNGACVPLAQSIWPFPGETADAADSEEFAGAAGIAGRIAVAGTVRNGSLSEGFLGWANAGNLAPVAPIQRYGLHGAGRESLRAIDVRSDRLVSAGSTATDWEAVGDRQDLYLVQPDAFLRTLCALNWTILQTPANLPYQRFEPVVKKVDPAVAVDTPNSETLGEGYCCELAPN